jgi:peptidoglycan biosynthesis protein MviN/MurJ (putative lipid II flippase)
MRVSLASVALNLTAGAALLLTPLREAGLALATALSSAAACVAYVVLLRRRGTGGVFAARAWLRPLLGAVVMGGGVAALLWWWPQPPQAGGRIAVLRLAAAVGLGAALYLAVAGRRRRR